MLPITVTICTLNEEANIAECLIRILEQDPKEVIVVDGDSDDQTREIATRFGVKVINAGRKGLAHQRKVAVDSAQCNYIGLFDADHRVPKNAIAGLIDDLEEYHYDGIEAQIRSVCNKGYWDWAMEKNFELSHNLPGPRIMIGTPCIYRAGPLKKINFDPFFTGPSDDTDLCYRMIKAGYRLGVGTPYVLQEHRSNFRECRKKWLWYGKGDAQFAWKHPERCVSIVAHSLFNYPIRKSFLALRSGKPRVIPFFILFGCFRHIGFLREMFHMIFLGKRVDTEIHKT